MKGRSRVLAVQPPAGTLRARQRTELRVESLAAGGAGVARLETGEVVFVSGAAPGDLAEVEIDREHKPARARTLRLLEPGIERVAPPCPHAGVCGGCDWMHLSVAAQEGGHRAIVEAALAHALPGVSLPAIVAHAAPRALGYRTRARFYLSSDRRGLRIGYRAAESHDLLPVDACIVLDPAIADVPRDVCAALAGARGKGDASIARGRAGLPVVSLAFEGELPARAWSSLDERVAKGAWAGAEVRLGGAARAQTFGDPRPVVEAADGAPLVMAAGGFAQPSDAGAAALARRVDAVARDTRPRKVLELFAGSGTLSVLLAREAASFSAVELAPLAADAARENLKSRGLAGRVAVGDAGAWKIPPDANVVVLDPPRAGSAGAARAIAGSSARVVVYVACDPVTLARDLAVLVAPGKLAITDIETFELFPQTSHVETVVRLARKPKLA